MLKWRFQRNLVLAFLLIGFFVQAISVGLTLYIVRNGDLDAEGTAAATFAADGARVVNHGVGDASRVLARYAIPATGPILSASLPSLIEGSRSSDRWYVIDRNSNKVLSTNASVPLSADTIDQAIARSASSSVAIVASAVDNAVVLAKRLPATPDRGAGYIVVAISPENALVSAISLLEPDKGTSLLLVDSAGSVLAANTTLGVSTLPSGFAAKAYQALNLAGREQLIAASRVPVGPANESTLSVVVLRDLDVLVKHYHSMRSGVLVAEAVLFLVIVAAALVLGSRGIFRGGRTPNVDADD